MGLEGLSHPYHPKMFLHSINSFYAQVRLRIVRSPKLFEFYATQPNRSKIVAAVALADEDWATGAPEQAVYLSVVRTYLKAMGGLKPAAGVKDWQPREESYATEALTILAERFEYYLADGGMIPREAVETWLDLIRITLAKGE